jgi:hypothetical protein
MLKFAVFTGSISGVTWLYAAFLGIARSLSWKSSLFELLIAYPALILMAYAIMHAAIIWSSRRHDLDLGEFLKGRM